MVRWFVPLLLSWSHLVKGYFGLRRCGLMFRWLTNGGCLHPHFSALLTWIEPKKMVFEDSGVLVAVFLCLCVNNITKKGFIHLNISWICSHPGSKKIYSVSVYCLAVRLHVYCSGSVSQISQKALRSHHSRHDNNNQTIAVQSLAADVSLWSPPDKCWLE